MNEHDDHPLSPQDDAGALRALRTSDPAARLVGPATLHERVALIAGRDFGSAVRERPRRLWLTPVAAAAALAIGIGGGYLFGSGVLDTTSAFAAPLLPVATGTPEDPAAPIASRDGDGDAGVTGDAASSTAENQSSSDSVSPWHYANNRRFTSPAFSSGPTEATVYALDGRAGYTEDDAERIAAELGLVGDAHAPADGSWHSWIVGDETQSGPVLHLSPSGDGYAWFSSGTADPWSACSSAASPRYDLSNGSEEVYRAYDAEVTQCVKNTPMPAEQQAREALSRFLAATGVDEDATDITVQVVEDQRIITATAARIVGGNITEVTSQVTVAHDGLLHAGGATAPVGSLGSYAIVSADEAAERLNDPVYAPAYAAETNREVEYDDGVVTEPPVMPTPGTAVPWGISAFEITSARLGLALLAGTDDERFLAPMYEFTDTEGNVWSVLALAESELDTEGGGRAGGMWGLTY